jgi:pimeloyl-ACP methyl ester carboxylesterase
VDNPRLYGRPPYSVAVIHGGPGGGGEMAPVARKLAAGRGVLEPIQTAGTLDGQVDELCAILEARAALPAVLIGYSWGAWLAFIAAARHPDLVRKLILVSSGPFQESFVPAIEATRLERLDPGEQLEYDACLKTLGDPAAGGKDSALARLGELAKKSDTFDPLEADEAEDDKPSVRGDIFSSVWEEAAGMRKSGELLAMGKCIACPVVAIHGDYDPHPAAGVLKPLTSVLGDFRFSLLKQCGHKPWMERQARDDFFAVLGRELA